MCVCVRACVRAGGKGVEGWGEQVSEKAAEVFPLKVLD